jgi:membrane-bound serine protease (ClpP class)
VNTEIAIIVSALIVGLVLLLVEIITPTFGILIGIGIISFSVAVWRSFLVSEFLGWTMLIALGVLIPAYLVMVVKLLPRSPLGRLLFLGKAPKATSDAAPESPALSVLVGQQGVAETPLRPGGAVRVGGQRIMARAERGMIDAGTSVKIIKAHGHDVVVRPLENEPT